MKIQRLQLFPVTVSRETGATNQHILVRLEAEDGLVGWGEISDQSHLPMYQFKLPDLERNLTGLLHGQPASDLLRLEDVLIRAYPEESYKYSRSASVRQGVELALLDLVGRAQGVPVYQLFGGKLRDRIRVCYPIFAMRSVDQVPGNLERVQARAEDGFDLIRVYVGANLDADELFLQKFVERFKGRVSVKSLDFSNALDWRRAWQATERLTHIVEPMLVESVAPHHDLDGLVEFRRRSRWPVSEHVFHLYHGWQLLSRGCVDILNISPYLLGGVRASLRLATLAEAAHVGVLIGTTQELNLGTAAIAHLGAVTRVLDYPSDSTGPKLYTQDIVKEPIHYEAGHLVVPHGPGLGVEVDEALLKEMSRIAHWTFSTDLPSILDRTPPRLGSADQK